MTGEPLSPAYPAVAAGQAAGSISERHARIVVQTVEKLPDETRHEHGVQLESDLVEFATRFDPDQLSTLARRMSDYLDPDGKLRDVAYRGRLRDVRLDVRADGSAHLVGDLTAECTERLLVTFDSLAAPKPECDGVKDPRTAGQRRHDALLDALAILQRNDSLPNAAGVSATVVVTMSAESYATGAGFARTDHGALVPAQEALAWAGGDLRLLAVVIDRVKGISAYSSAHRLFSEAQRLAMRARDGGCTFPNCGAPPGQCQAHHLRDYDDGGPTSVDDGVLVCGYDHRERIRQGWTATLIAGRAAWIPPSWIDPQRVPRYNELHHPPAASQARP